MKYISSKDIVITKKRLNNNHEYCGYLVEVPSSERVKMVDSGTHGRGKDGRVMCIQKPPYQKYLWHTHPNTSKSYPSAEDIITMLKPRSNTESVLDSVIFTKWGIWELHCKNKHDVSCLDPQKLSNMFTDLYKATGGGRDNADKAVIVLTNQNLMLYLVEWQFEISFTSWDSGVEDYYLRYT